MIEFSPMTLPSEYIGYFIVGLIVFDVIILCWLVYLCLRLRRLLGGKGVKNLESTILELHKNAKENGIFRSDMEVYLSQVEKRLRRALQSVETIRFDAFKGGSSSGNQSFSTAYVNEKGDGVMLSSLSARERVSFFSKAIKNWESSQELSPEEKEVLDKAKQKLLL